MANKILSLHFVRCPKCLKVLAEPPGIHLYKCGQCGSILRAKVHSNKCGENFSLGSSKILSYGNAIENENAVSSSCHPVVQNQAPKESSNAEEICSVSNAESSDEKLRTQIIKKNGVKDMTLENKRQLEKEYLELETKSEYNKANGKLRNLNNLLLRSSSNCHGGHDCSASSSSTDEERRKQALSKTFGSRRFQVIGGKLNSRDDGLKASQRDFSHISEGFKSARNLMESESDTLSISKSKYSKHSPKSRYSEKPDKVKIMRKVDELKDELIGFFDKASLKHSTSLRRMPQVTPPNLPSNDEKVQIDKRYCRPVSGGAPFVICYRCFNLLQLPTDFLVSTKRTHKLRCGSCDEILKYVFRPRTRLTLQASLGEAILGGKAVLYSEECKLSLFNSTSYEPEASQVLEMHDGIVEEEQGGGESEAQLHKLMGYSSARYLLFEALSVGGGHRAGQDR